jgi:hypothetical protein
MEYFFGGGSVIRTCKATLLGAVEVFADQVTLIVEQ